MPSGSSKMQVNTLSPGPAAISVGVQFDWRQHDFGARLFDPLEALAEVVDPEREVMDPDLVKFCRRARKPFPATATTPHK